MNYVIDSFLSITEKPIVEKPNMHSHDTYEIYAFLGGKVDYLVEGKRYRLRKGDIMLMRKGEMHINNILSDVTYKRIAVNFEITNLLNETDNIGLLDMFNARPLGEYNHYKAKDFPDNHWMSYLNAICETENKNEKLCYLLPLLNDLDKCYMHIKNSPADGENNLVVEICKYINADLSQDLSLEKIAETFYISKTHLNRLFKTSVGTTVGKYIKLKRLFFAKELIQKGERPMDIYAKCGFNDYTTFYRSFKKYFLVSPKETSV